MKTAMWVDAFFAVYGVVLVALWVSGLIFDLPFSPFLLVPIILYQVYQFFSCSQRNRHRDKFFHLASISVLSFAVVFLFYLSLL